MTEKRGLPTVRDILYVFFKNKVLISSIFLTALVAAMVYCYLAPPVYRAETKLLVRIGKAQVSGIEQYRPESYNILFQERSQNIRN
ncbi:MAG TPA: Wzz/FepE/Etk N-terminal domain-containing protein, partial [Syntrophobacteraceae bacterium]|nr:Wzz/FepE/Etk N-terminal domain-containing protein [Syntrophobacteraceae bacterium]